MKNVNRRDFLKKSTTAVAGMAIVGPAVSFAESQAKAKTIKVGIIGTGGRGRGLLGLLLGFDGVEIPAVCDINPQALSAAREMVTAAGQSKPQCYSKDEYVYKKLLSRDDLDAVIIATPWAWHSPMAVDGMKAGKYVGVEVPAAQTLDECHQLVRTYEQTKMPCMMLENWSFRRDNLAVLNMIRKGLLGEIVHCHCAHSHDCIDHWFFDSQTGMDRWAAKYLVNRNRDQYPTHQLGPVISWMDIGCGDYFDYITSTATDCFGINDYFTHKFGPDHPNAKRKYAQGDIVTTVVRTKKGKTIVINYDMQLPRPYDNRWMIQGTGGIYNEQRESVHIKGKSPEYHEWEPFEPYQQEYEHSWTKSSSGHEGHGGTDYLELKLFTEAVRNKTRPPLDVYDSVIMSAIGPLSQQSIALGSAPVQVPDFTRGKWKTNKPVFAVEI
jgi:predicted dehydrogenase